MIRRLLAAAAVLAAASPCGLRGQGDARPTPRSQASPVEEDAAVIAATREYQRTGRARVLQVGAYLVYPYNLSQPTLTCAPLKACTIQLQGGERAMQPYSGDSERWFIGTSPGPRGTTLVVVQPSDCNLTTNLTIPTDRHLYQLTLDSPPCSARDTARQNPDLPYTRLLRFYYPQELVEQLARSETAAADTADARAAREIPVAPAAGADPTQLEFGYFTCRDPGFPWRPDQVFADRDHTYIMVPAERGAAGRPLLFELTPDGRTLLINYAQRGSYLVADRALQRAVLIVSGAGGAEQRLLVTRNRNDCYGRR